MTDKTSASNQIQLLLLHYINSPLPFASDPLSARLPSWVFCHLHQTHNPLGLQSPLYCRWWHLSRFHLACSGTKSPLRQSVKCLFHWTVWHAMHLVILLNCTSFIFVFAFEMSFCPVAAGIQSPYKRDSTSIPCTKKDSAWQVWPLSRCLSAKKLDRNKLKLAQPLQHNLLCHPFAALCLRRGSNHCTDLQVDGEIWKDDLIQLLQDVPQCSQECSKILVQF